MKFRCPWCGRNVGLAGKSLQSHVDFGGKKCIAVGMNLTQAQAQRRLMDSLNAQTPTAR